jgi:hypothetical protein
VASYEEDGPLPEICTLGNRVMYQALYDDQGVLAGAVKFSDPRLVLRCREFIESVYNAGEPLAEWFGGHVAHLPPPARQAPE